MVEHGAHALGTLQRQTPHRGTRDQHRARAERQRLHDVGAAADAAVDIDLGALTDGGDDLGQRVATGNRCIEVAAAMVRHDQRLHARIEEPQRIVAAQHALGDDRKRRALHQPVEIAPGGGKGDRAAMGRAVEQLRDRAPRRIGIADLGRRRDRRARRARRGAVDRLVDGEHDRAVSARDRAVDQILSGRALGRQVELEPARRRAGLGRHLLDAVGRGGRQHEQRIGRRCPARGRALALRMEQLMPPERRHHDRRREHGSQHRDAGIDIGDVVEHARPQPELAPRGDVFGERDLVVRARRGECIGARRKLRPRFFLERVEIGAVQDSLSPRPASSVVMAGHSRPKDGVASLRLCPGHLA